MAQEPSSEHEDSEQLSTAMVKDRTPWTDVSDAGYVVREWVWKGLRGLARALRPVTGRRVFEALYGFGRVGYFPRVEQPGTFVEKLLWLKRYYRHPLMPQLADKLGVREYAASRVEWLRFPTLFQVAERPEDIDLDRLPLRAVIKPTHQSGHVAFWRPDAPGGTNEMRGELRATMAGWTGSTYQKDMYEWFYEGVKPRWIAEEDLSDEAGTPPADYKVFVINGNARLIQVFAGRAQQLVRVMFDRDWNVIPAWRGHRHGSRPVVVPNSDLPARPQLLQKLLSAAESLAEPFPFARIDFYIVQDELYLGEVTFMPASGYVPFEPRVYDRLLGAELKLPTTKTATGTGG